MESTTPRSPLRLPALLLALSCLFLTLPAHAQLSAGETADLQYLREEEKLARDLYSAFYALWDSDIFLNIATSEQRHMDAVLNLLTLYGISDPAAGQPAGQFTDAALQNLYDDLLDQGSGSEIAALEAGIFVEETDIADLETAIAGTDEAAIRRVYGNLLKGSQNHYSAFSNRLLQLDSTADPGNGFGPGDGTAVFEPFSLSLYIPAIDVTTKGGATQVFDGLLRVVETVPLTFELLTVSRTDKLPNPEHASFDIAGGVLLIPRLSVGTQQVDSLNDTEYAATLVFSPAGGALLFIVDTLTPL